MTIKIKIDFNILSSLQVISLLIRAKYYHISSLHQALCLWTKGIMYHQMAYWHGTIIIGLYKSAQMILYC